jgi:hypothetical protein
MLWPKSWMLFTLFICVVFYAMKASKHMPLSGKKTLGFQVEKFFEWIKLINNT